MNIKKLLLVSLVLSFSLVLSCGEGSNPTDSSVSSDSELEQSSAAGSSDESISSETASSVDTSSSETISSEGTSSSEKISSDGASSSEVSSSSIDDPSQSPPVASQVSITGTAEVPAVLTGSYQFDDAEGDEESASQFKWYRNGEAIDGATTNSYQLDQDDFGAEIVFEVTPVSDSDTESVGVAVKSSPVTIADDNAPVIENLALSAPAALVGLVEEGAVLTLSYDYSDVENATEGTPEIKWYRDDVVIDGQTQMSYTIDSLDVGHSVWASVTPIATAGKLKGIAVNSDSLSAIYTNLFVENGLVDSRDSREYDIAYIGSKIWMAQNLSYEANGDRYCYGAYTCDHANYQYGGLYTWKTATDSVNREYGDSSNIQGICPTNWHIPNLDDWWDLIISSDKFYSNDSSAHVLKSTTKWTFSNQDYNGSNELGFNILPTGYGDWGAYDGVYQGEYKQAYIWTSVLAQSDKSEANYITVSTGSTDLSIRAGEVEKKYSIRCVHD